MFLSLHLILLLEVLNDCSPEFVYQAIKVRCSRVLGKNMKWSLPKFQENVSLLQDFFCNHNSRTLEGVF